MSAPSDRIANVGFLIKDIGRLFTKVFEREADHLGITLAEARVLIYLSRNPGVTQVQLAELTSVEPMTLVRILDRMEADKWIERRPHPTDRRARQLLLKERAQQPLEQINKLAAQVRSQVLAGLSTNERLRLVGSLEHIHGRLLDLLAERSDTSAGDNAAGRTRSQRAIRLAAHSTARPSMKVSKIQRTVDERRR
jgi:DNA-binding MarR family transcriptional regulator